MNSVNRRDSIEIHIPFFDSVMVENISLFATFNINPSLAGVSQC